ncbi:molybdopterin-binding protein [Streptomyces sp. NBC_01012]|uniref:TOBE domain-containing protein n=1 Tax=Streptomyces sp. NBC_01012 TaxID=2903717 RepID=UPI003865D4E6|nr:TOBE domain-containing protein [Streptomyces sp. NBC_01012]
MPSYSIGQAAELLAVSPETVRRWADGGHLTMDRGGSGNRMIDGVSLAGFATERAEGLHPVPGEILTSVRNSFAGIVTAVTADDVVAQVEIQSGPHRLVSLVSRESVDELGLEVGVLATARVKSTNVHIDRPRP